MVVNDFFALAPRKVTPTHPPTHTRTHLHPTRNQKSPDLKHDTYSEDERGKRLCFVGLEFWFGMFECNLRDCVMAVALWEKRVLVVLLISLVRVDDMR
jgi:hypothetical protein